MSKCELLPKGCDCGSTEAAKCQQSDKSPRQMLYEHIYVEYDCLSTQDELESIERIVLNGMKSREEIEGAITRMEAEIETGLDVFHETYYQNKIEALKWVLNEI